MDEDEVPTPPPIITLDVLAYIKENQLTHGLRANDFERYRQFCTRRLGRMYKSVRFTHGTGKRYVKRQVTAEVATEVRHVEILLLQAERAWAYAEQLKEENSEGDLRKQHHCTGKLSRAAKWSTDFYQLTLQRCDTRTQLQAEAYENEMKGGCQAGKGNWEEALRLYTKARDIWTETPLPNCQPSKQLVTQRVTEIEQSRRLCWYKAGREMSDFTTMDGATEAARGGMGAGGELEWRGMPLRLHTDKLRGFFSDMQQTRVSIEQDTAAAANATGTTAVNATLEHYTKLFVLLNDSLAAVKQDIRTETGDATALRLLENYLNFSFADENINRNLFLAESYTERCLNDRVAKQQERRIGPPDIVRLYELLEQNIVDLMGVPGVEDDPTFSVKYENLSLTCRAKKMYWKGEAFARAGQHVEAVACHTNAETCVSNCFVYQREHELETSDSTCLSEMIRSAKCIVTATAYLESVQAVDAVTGSTAALALGEAPATSSTLIDNLDEYLEFQRLIPLPLDADFQDMKFGQDIIPQMIPEPEEEPADAAVVEPEPEPEPEPQRRGWFSWFRQG